VSSRFKSKGFDWVSFFFSGLTGLATLLILCILAVIIGNIVIEGIPYLSWRFVSSGVEQGMFNIQKSGVLPMILGTSARVILMTIFVIPVGVITAIYITEYAHTHSLLIRFIRGAVNNLAGVPSVVFGLFGLGFFIGFIGKHMDEILHPNLAQPIWSKPALLWASMTLAVMTLPVVIVATEESLKAIPQGLREASLALGATKLQTILRIVLPQALPGILTGGILAISRAAGEVAPIMFTGAAYFISGLPKSLSDQFMDLGYHIYILSTQSPNIEQTRPLLQATVLVLLMLTFALNFVAILIRAKIRKRMRAFH
jgi:phosphate transport system permease protein